MRESHPPPKNARQQKEGSNVPAIYFRHTTALKNDVNNSYLNEKPDEVHQMDQKKLQYTQSGNPEYPTQPPIEQGKDFKRTIFYAFN